MKKAFTKALKKASNKLSRAVTLQDVRTAATHAGLSLLGMAILAPIAHFGILGGLSKGNLISTLEAITDSSINITLAIVCLTIVVALDGIVAYNLAKLLKPSKQRLISLMAWTRIVYAAVFLVAISFLVAMVFKIGSGSTLVSPTVLSDLKGFNVVWDIALVIFAVHLLLLGWLFYKAKYTPTWLGVLLAIAGIGYAIDSFAKYTINDYSLEVSTVTFVGEVVLIVWLLFSGRRLTDNDLKKRL